MDEMGLVIIGLLRAPSVLIKLSNFENRSFTHWAGIGRSSWQELTQMEHIGCPCSWGGAAPQNYVEIAKKDWLFWRKKRKKHLHLKATHMYSWSRPTDPTKGSCLCCSIDLKPRLSVLNLYVRQEEEVSNFWVTNLIRSDQSVNGVSENVNIDMI